MLFKAMLSMIGFENAVTQKWLSFVTKEKPDLYCITLVKLKERNYFAVKKSLALSL